MEVSACRKDIPDWVKENWYKLCPECGCYIADNSDTGATTARWCLNPACPGHMSYKAKVLADFFGIKGFGVQTAKSYIRPNNYKSHFDFMHLWFKDVKPMVTLADVAVLACIEGYSATSANKELNSYTNFEQYFATCSEINPLLFQHKDELIYAEKFFTLKPPVSAKKMFVMGTGSFHGYSSREEFFRLINDAYGQSINVIQTGKRKTGVSYLIKEADAIDHSKSRIARENNIPIVTPSEFVSIIESMCPYISK